MKIIAIRGRNLASLEGDFEVDFTQEPLKSSGIYAITGNTGSGKSTLLDTLCLALFDETPRISKAGENIAVIDVNDKSINQKDSRNILRRGSSEGYAEVDFIALSGESYRSTWLVRRARNKPNGALQSSEMRLLNTSTNIEEQGRKTELLARVVELIGLNFDQFTRAVLLAQGDFATFLKAKQSEKAELLEKLTGTDVYSRISVAIYDKTKDAEQALTVLEEKIKDVELLSEEGQQALQEEQKTLQEDLNLLKTELTCLAGNMKWFKEEESLLHNITSAEEALRQATHSVKDAQPRYDFLKKVDSVQDIRDTFNDWQNSRKQLNDTQITIEKQKKLQTEYATSLTREQQQINEAEDKQQQHNETIERTTPQIKQAQVLDVELSHANKQEKETHKELQEAQTQKKHMEQAILQITKHIEQIQQKTQSIAHWFEVNNNYKDIVPRVELLVSLLDDAAVAGKQAGINRQTLQHAEKLLTERIPQLQMQQAEEERLNQLLPAEIAVWRTRLEDGKPCPICGSLHHPLQGINNEQSLQEEELNRAKQTIQEEIVRLSTQIEQAKIENTRLQSVINSYQKQEQDTLAKLESYLAILPSWKADRETGRLQATLKTIAEQWNKGVLEMNQLREQLSNEQTTLLNEQKRIAEINSSLTVKAQKHQATQEVLVMKQKDRARLLNGQSVDEVETQLAEKKKQLSTHIEQLNLRKQKIMTQQDALTGMMQQLTSAQKTLTDHCNLQEQVVLQWLASQKDIINLDQLAQLLSKDNAWLTREREALTRLKTTALTSQATLEERRQNLEKHHASDQKPADRESKESIPLLQAEKNLLSEQKTKRNMEIEIAFSNHNKGKERIKAFENELQTQSLLTGNWRKLNMLLGSATGAKFKEIAQGYTLDALLTYANRHLSELTKRYQLQRIPDSLGLQVVDLDMLGEVRSVHLLSGGESFLISLALALGLSSLSSNKMKIESLFIDEGFGSLDIETLRVAMDALEQLQIQGRKIGVISHVAEMTEHISTQIRVIKVNNGRSRIEITGTAAQYGEKPLA